MFSFIATKKYKKQPLKTLFVIDGGINKNDYGKEDITEKRTGNVSVTILRIGREVARWFRLRFVFSVYQLISRRFLNISTIRRFRSRSSIQTAF
jgi:hypothetical protein